MRNLTFSTKLLSEYYNTLFFDDLSRYYCIGRNEDYIKVIPQLSLRGEKYIFSGNILKRNETLPAAIRAEYGQDETLPEPSIPDGTLEEEYMFVGLVSFIFAAEASLNTWYKNTDQRTLSECMNNLGWPWISCAGDIELIDFFKKSGFAEQLCFKQGVEALRDAMLVIEPFMMQKLLSHMSGWEQGKLKETSDFLGAPIGRKISDGLVKLNIKETSNHHKTD